MRLARAIALCFVLIATGVIGTAAPAVANQLGIEPASRTVVRNTDFGSFGVGGMRGNGSGSISVTGVSGTVTKALLYWNGPTNSTDPQANASVSFAGHSITGTNIGFSNDNCWFFLNSQSYGAEVTTFVSGNGDYALSGFRKTETVGETTTTVADINGASLIVFFHDSIPSNDRDVTMVDGNDSNVPNAYDTDGWDSTIPGVDYSSGTANLQLHVSDGQSGSEPVVNLNGTTFGSPDGKNFQGDSVPPPVSGGNLWDIKNFDITSFMNPGSQNLKITMAPPAPGDCLSLVAALVDVPTASRADLAVTQTASPTSVTPGANVQFLVTITNNGPDGAIGVKETNNVTGGTVSSATPSQGTCNAAGTQCSLGDLVAGGTATVNLMVQAGTSGTVTNTASVSAVSPPDPNPNNNTNTTSASILTPTQSQDDAATFYDGTQTTIETSRDTTGGFWSKIIFPAGMTPGPVFIHEVPASTLPTYCAGNLCDAQIQFSGVPLGTASPTNPIQVFWFYTKVWKQGSTVYVQGESEPLATVVRNCVTPGIANPPKCVSSRTILPNGDREFLLLWTNGGDPGGGKR